MEGWEKKERIQGRVPGGEKGLSWGGNKASDKKKGKRLGSFMIGRGKRRETQAVVRKRVGKLGGEVLRLRDANKRNLI